MKKQCLRLFFIFGIFSALCVSMAACQSAKKEKPEEFRELSDEEIESMTLEELEVYLAQQKKAQEKSETKKWWLNSSEKEGLKDVSKSRMESGESINVFPWKSDSNTRSENLREKKDGSVFYDW